jgi:hypothetical protein
MDLSSPKLRKILIGLAIFTVVVFIAVKIWRRSYYSYPNTSEDAQVPITAMTQAASVVTVAAAGHNFKVGDIVLLNVVGPTITTTSGVMPTVSGTTGTPVIVASISAAVSFTFAGSFTGSFTSGTAEAVGYGVMTALKSALVACQDIYAQEVINNVAGAVANRTDCIAKAVAPYTRGHCQWLPADGQPLPVPTAGDALIAYTAYQNDIKTIQLAYVSTANRAAAGQFAGLTADITKANAIVSAARAADITGATQKYLATVCPGFYMPGDPDKASEDPSTAYKGWTAVSAASDALPQTAGSQKHFYASSTGGITDAAVMTWAQYARPVTFTAGTGLTATTGYLTTSVTSGGTTYSDKSGLTGGTANGENWRLAYANGPGTYPAPTWKTTA